MAEGLSVLAGKRQVAVRGGVPGGGQRLDEDAISMKSAFQAQTGRRLEISGRGGAGRARGCHYVRCGYNDPCDAAAHFCNL